MTEKSTLPHWDMTVVYPSLESAEFEEGFQSALRAIDDLVALAEAHGIQKRDPAPLDDETIQAFEIVTERLNQVFDQVHTLGAYIWPIALNETSGNEPTRPSWLPGSEPKCPSLPLSTASRDKRTH